MFLSEPVEHANVHGYRKLTNQYTGSDVRLQKAQFALPLRPEVLEFFPPEALDEIVQIDVYHSGEVEVRLRLQLGEAGATRPVEVRRRYQTAQHSRAEGPSVALYPTFKHEKWRDHAVFCRSANDRVAALISVVPYIAGKPAEVQRARRSPTVQILAMTAAPESLAFISSASGTGQADSYLGILAPSYQPIFAASQSTWTVGVDFGTSNTVVCVRGDGGHASPLRLEDGLLELTKSGHETLRAMSGYFFPERFQKESFGTAVLHSNYLETFDLAAERPGLRINVPFDGLVDADAENSVVGDLKWSPDLKTDFLAGSFLRTVLSIVMAEALKHGIDPANVNIRWAYPRAFSKAQVNNLHSFWRTVIASFRAGGLAVNDPGEPMDESVAVLSHFFNQTRLAPGGPMSVVMDVGGGTTDIAVYERGQALVLDSVVFGGKNLTGQRVQGNTALSRANPFVRAFAEWARSNGLGTHVPEGAALAKYLHDDQDHLAFAYAVSSEWFAGNGRRFTGRPEFQAMQSQVLYFYAALFYYIGLALRAARPDGSSGARLPSNVIVAGNGSRYLHWLTDLEPRPDKIFLNFVARMMAEGADAAEEALPTVEISDHPKSEVALGLVAKVAPGDLGVADAVGDTLAGEHVRVTFDGAAAQSLTPTSRLRPDQAFSAATVSTLHFDPSASEISRFHEAFVKALPDLARYGSQWGSIGTKLRARLNGLSLAAIHTHVSSRLQYLAQEQDGFRGSLFILEAAAVLELTANESSSSGNSQQRDGVVRPVTQ